MVRRTNFKKPNNFNGLLPLRDTRKGGEKAVKKPASGAGGGS
jgi:hypothetical protein